MMQTTLPHPADLASFTADWTETLRALLPPALRATLDGEAPAANAPLPGDALPEPLASFTVDGERWQFAVDGTQLMLWTVVGALPYSGEDPAARGQALARLQRLGSVSEPPLTMLRLKDRLVLRAEAELAPGSLPREVLAAAVALQTRTAPFASLLRPWLRRLQG